MPVGPPRFAQFRGATEPEFTAWLREIMAHAAAKLARDHRRQRRDVRQEQRLYNLLNQTSQTLERALADPNPSPSHNAVRRERAVLLANDLSQLPVDYLEVLVLRELEGKSLGEAGAAIGRTPNAVRKLWARLGVINSTAVRVHCQALSETPLRHCSDRARGGRLSQGAIRRLVPLNAWQM